MGLGAVVGVRCVSGCGDIKVLSGINCCLTNSDAVNTAQYHVTSNDALEQFGALTEPGVYGSVNPIMSTRYINSVDCFQSQSSLSLNSSIKECVSDTALNELAYAHTGLPYEYTRQGGIKFHDFHTMFVQGKLGIIPTPSMHTLVQEAHVGCSCSKGSPTCLWLAVSQEFLCISAAQVGEAIGFVGQF